MSHAGFLADISEHPEDDTPRLIFADWLDDHGDSDRAEFIRLQVEAARLPEGDPRACDLDSKAEGILAEFETAWLGEWSERLVRWSFRRGFLDKVTLLPDVFLTDGAKLFDLWPVREVRFVGQNGDEIGEDAIDPVTASPALGRVRSLDASGAHTAFWADCLSRGVHGAELRELSLADDAPNAAQALGLDGLCDLCSVQPLVNLEALDLGTVNEAETDGLWIDTLADLSRSHRLRSLVLDGRRLEDSGIARLGTDPVFAELERVRLGDSSRVSPGMVSVLLGSSVLSRLTELCIGWECQLPELAKTPLLRQLKRLDLWPSNQIVYSPASWAAFAGALLPGRLLHLGLAHSILGQESVEALLGSPGLRGLHGLAIWGGDGVGDRVLEMVAKGGLGLTSLDLPRTGVSASGIKALAASPHLARFASLRFWWDEVWPPAQLELLGSSHLSPRLRNLDLAGWHLRDEGLEILANNPGLSGLTRLALRGCGLGTAGMQALVDSPHLGRLTALHLGWTPDDALDILGESTGLPRLREVVVDPRVRRDTLALLRSRFGPRLIVDQRI